MTLDIELHVLRGHHTVRIEDSFPSGHTRFVSRLVAITVGREKPRSRQ